ncbi:tetratricopeptide repeat protein, partial [Salmonella sp. SAL4445]|uniref:tetratricopeptide repeat protein n=1 Tax=Salmonella sp. SAL4445 TaxID=3159900 RepID=UPI0039781EEE
MHLARGAVELSLADYDAAVSVDPSCPDAYIGRAAAYQALGDAEQAAWDLGRALALDPSRAEAHRGIVLADLALGDEY